MTSGRLDMIVLKDGSRAAALGAALVLKHMLETAIRDGRDLTPRGETHRSVAPWTEIVTLHNDNGRIELSVGGDRCVHVIKMFVGSRVNKSGDVPAEVLRILDLICMTLSTPSTVVRSGVESPWLMAAAEHVSRDRPGSCMTVTLPSPWNGFDAEDDVDEEYLCDDETLAVLGNALPTCIEMHVDGGFGHGTELTCYSCVGSDSGAADPEYEPDAMTRLQVTAEFHRRLATGSPPK